MKNEVCFSNISGLAYSNVLVFLFLTFQPRDGAIVLWIGIQMTALYLFPSLPSPWPVDQSLVGHKLAVCLCFSSSPCPVAAALRAGRGQPTLSAPRERKVFEMQWSVLGDIVLLNVLEVSWRVFISLCASACRCVFLRVFCLAGCCVIVACCWFSTCLLPHPESHRFQVYRVYSYLQN